MEDKWSRWREQIPIHFQALLSFDGDIITCELTSNSACATTTNATSNSIVVALNAPIVSTIDIAISTTDTLCYGSLLTFTSSVTNQGTAPSYVWQINGVNTSNTGSIFNTSSLLNNDVVTCQLTSNLTCATPVTSAGITVNVKHKLNPQVVVSSSANPICPGSTVTFNATVTDGGVSPSFQWKVNGVNAGTNSPVFSSSAIVNGDEVSCVLTISESTCIVSSSATSNSITMMVTPPLAPSISITPSPGASVCIGTNVVFSSAPSSIGASPSYQWLLNGLPVGGDSMTYASNSFVTGDIVNCVVTTSSACESNVAATSSNITMTVNDPVTPSVSISTASTTVCSGYNTTFTATPTNGGSPTYQWKVNGSNVGTNSSSFSTTTLVEGDVVSCEMTTFVNLCYSNIRYK